VLVQLPKGTLTFLTLALVGGTLFAGLDDSGLWEPVELDGAELARRLSLNVFGAHALATGSADTMPTLNELGRGELGIDSIAFGFRLFGLREWAGRLPLALWAFVGVVALHALVGRTQDFRAAAYSALALAGMPLYFVHARTMLGDAAAFGCFSLALAGLGIFTLRPPAGRALSTLSLAIGVVGMLLGVLARGIVFGATLPLLAVGCAAHLERRRLSLCFLFAGALALIVGAVALVRARSGTTPVLLGAAVLETAAPSFDAGIGELVHGLFPWSALLPFALARLLVPNEDAAPRILFLSGAGLALAAHQFMGIRVGGLPFVALPCLAGAIGLSIRDLEKGASPSPIAALAGAAIAFLVVRDVLAFPEKVLPLQGAEFPKSLIATARLELVTAGCVVGALSSAALLVDAHDGPAWPRVRTASLLLGALIATAILRLLLFPALGEQVAPRRAFESYRRLADQHAPLGLLGTTPVAARYAGIEPVFVATSSGAALDWLLARNERRFLVLRGESLAELNALHRDRVPGKNLPIADGQSSLVLLATNELTDRSQNPLDEIVKTPPVAPNRPSLAELERGIKVLGWDLLDERGEPKNVISGSFRLHVYYQIGQLPPVGHCTFLHIDHETTRHSEEHREWIEYPMRLWHAGDVIVDRYTVKPSAGFHQGRHPVLVGFGVLPCNDDRRLSVVRGDSDGRNRVRLGEIEYR
jgi:4-amino-4-deoxy-L-arabinose transferase-like glycosyltransferase